MSKPVAPAHTPVTITLAKAYCGSVMRPSNEFEGTFTVHGTAQSLEQVATLIVAAPDAVELVIWLQDYLKRNTLGTVKTEHGVGTVVDRHLIELKLNAFLTKATGGAE